MGGEDANRTRIVMEIRAGTGGDEAALFARDLYEMYKHHAESRGWKLEVLKRRPAYLIFATVVAATGSCVVWGCRWLGSYCPQKYKDGYGAAISPPTAIVNKDTTNGMCM